MPQKKIIIVANAAQDEEIWWWPYMPNAEDGTVIDLIKIPETSSGLASLFIKLCLLYRNLRQYDLVITLQDGYATFLFSFLNSLFPFYKNYKHIVHEFITSPLKPNKYSKLKYTFLRFSFKSIDSINCSAKPEIDYYRTLMKLDANQFNFVPLSTHPKFLDIPTSESSDYIISAGRTGRDYETLAKAISNTNLKLIIIADYYNLKDIDLPKNVEVRYNTTLNELIQLTANSKFVVIPLHKSDISTGQSVILEAMALGKAVISTRTGGTEDYIQNNVSGLLVDAYDYDQLHEAIIKLKINPKLAKDMGNRGRELVIKRHLPPTNILKVCKIIKKLT